MARKVKKRSKFTNRRNVLLLLAVVLVLIGGALAFRHHQSNTTQTPTSPTPSDSSNNINYGPPTSQDKSDVQAHKDDLSQNSQSSSPSTSNGKKEVTPFITGADQNTVTAYVPGVFEDNGSCIATYSHGSTTLTKTVQAFANATYTSCAPINTASSFFNSTGQWSVNVAYKSASSEGTSSQSTFEVQ